jgi:serine/threonine protein kinase
MGGGGNAEVYRATREGTDAEVALKVLKVQEARREPYRRFAREVEFQQGLTIDDGVLPLIRANVPDEPTPEDQAWLAMPIAIPIRDALAGEPLGTVVDAVGTIANNLAKLAAERGVAHRDIKQNNLYFYDEDYLKVFSLIAAPV